MEEDKRTIHEWENEFGVTIIFPEGFNLSDPNLFERKMSREEFEEGMLESSVTFKAKNKN